MGSQQVPMESLEAGVKQMAVAQQGHGAAAAAAAAQQRLVFSSFRDDLMAVGEGGALVTNTSDRPAGAISTPLPPGGAAKVTVAKGGGYIMIGAVARARLEDGKNHADYDPTHSGWKERPRTKRHWYTRQHTSRTTNATNKTLLARARGRVLTPLVVCVSAIVTFTHVSWRSPCVAPGPVAHATGRRAVTWASARQRALPPPSASPSWHVARARRRRCCAACRDRS